VGAKHRIEVPGGRFHITNRGNGYADIFRDDVDYADFLRKFAEVVAECGWLCHAYCLMPNHYHLVVETPEANRAFGMQRLNGRWARWFNRRHGRVGHLFQGPYRDEPISQDEHLLELFRYLALNPVRRGLCDAPEDWPWSSYAATIGTGDPPTFLTLELVHSLFGSGGLAEFVASRERPQPA
jgi:REP element-mobilizing transposase RayT